MKTSQSALIRLIAVFRLLKAAILIVTGIGFLKLMHNDVATMLDHWVIMLGLDPGNRFVDHALRQAANIPPDKIKDLGLEWFTVVITASLIPLEIWEIHHHPTAVKIMVLAINAAVVAYLLYRIRKEGSGISKSD